MGEEVGEQSVEVLDRHRIVVVPPDRGLGVRVADDELVLRAASGMRARIGDKGPMRGDPRFVALQRVLVELRRAEVPVDLGKIAETETVRAEVDIMRPVLDHVSSVLPKGAPKWLARKSKQFHAQRSTRRNRWLTRARHTSDSECAWPMWR